MTKVPVKILGTGIYLPPHKITSEDLEKTLGFASGTFFKTSGVNCRYYAKEEPSSEMGAKAAINALEAAKLDISQVDAIISVSGVSQQAIPSTAALIHRRLGMKRTVAFDINSTCISFLTGFFIVGNLIASGVYKHVLLVSADVASAGLNPTDAKTASLFGDGAAAVVLGPSDTSGIIDSHFETLSEHGDACQCEGGGTLLGIREDVPRERHYFQMNGTKLFKVAMPPLMEMIKKLTQETKIDIFIPHQASPLALDLIQKKLKLSDSQFIHIVRDYGNMIATSIPFALHKAIESGKLKRGDHAFLMGTAAGVSIGGLVFEY